ncbi:MAG: hypothetical protein ABSG89_01120 [Bacteroidales bacterium]|jgi:hypothetical protein
MKKYSLIFAIIFLAAIFSQQRIFAQDSYREENQKDSTIQESIAAQKKAMEDMHQAMEEARRSYEDALKNNSLKIQDSDKIFKMLKGYKDFAKNRPFPYITFDMEPGFDNYGHFNNEAERTTWDFSKSVKGTSFSRDYTIDVEPNANTVVIAVNGDCKSGDIHIKITMPGGKVYSDIVIDESGNLNWRKSFNISNDENKDKVGAWNFEINSSKASGYFKISLQTY